LSPPHGKSLGSRSILKKVGTPEKERASIREAIVEEAEEDD
jgi:hypothetical protein